MLKTVSEYDDLKSYSYWSCFDSDVGWIKIWEPKLKGEDHSSPSLGPFVELFLTIQNFKINSEETLGVEEELIDGSPSLIQPPTNFEVDGQSPLK